MSGRLRAMCYIWLLLPTSHTRQGELAPAPEKVRPSRSLGQGSSFSLHTALTSVLVLNDCSSSRVHKHWIWICGDLFPQNFGSTQILPHLLPPGCLKVPIMGKQGHPCTSHRGEMSAAFPWVIAARPRAASLFLHQHHHISVFTSGCSLPLALIHTQISFHC